MRNRDPVTVKENPYYDYRDELKAEQDFLDAETSRICNEFPLSIFDFISPSIDKEILQGVDDCEVEDSYLKLTEIIAMKQAKINLKRRKDDAYYSDYDAEYHGNYDE